MKPIPRPFTYATAAESQQPGYLARKFAAERKRLKDAERERTQRPEAANVKPLVRAKV